MSISDLGGSAAVNFNTLNNTIYTALQSQETRLRATLAAIQTDADGNVSQADLLRMQQQVQQWTLMVNIQSTITKQIGDSLKEVIQKAS